MHERMPLKLNNFEIRRCISDNLISEPWHLMKYDKLDYYVYERDYFEELSRLQKLKEERMELAQSDDQSVGIIWACIIIVICVEVFFIKIFAFACFIVLIWFIIKAIKKQFTEPKTKKKLAKEILKNGFGRIELDPQGMKVVVFDTFHKNGKIVLMDARKCQLYLTAIGKKPNIKFGGQVFLSEWNTCDIWLVSLDGDVMIRFQRYCSEEEVEGVKRLIDAVKYRYSIGQFGPIAEETGEQTT